MKDILKKYFPIIDDLQLIEIISNNCALKQLKAGKIIVSTGDQIRMMPLVTDGAIKVSREDNEGEELLLYFIYPGQTCSLTFNSHNEEKPSEIKAVIEEDCNFIEVPIAYIQLWIDKFPSWRKFLFSSCSTHLSELLHTIDSIAFSKMDDRLKDYLNHKFQQANTRQLKITHKEIAKDLHTSREAISRLLKEFKKNGEVELGRNLIKLK